MWKMVKKLVIAIAVVFFGLLVLGVLIAVTHPNPTPTTQRQPAAASNDLAAAPVAPEDKEANLKSPATGGDFVEAGGRLENILKVRHCARESATIRCRVSMVKGDNLDLTSLDGFLISGHATKFEGSGKNISIIDLPGTIVQAPDLHVGSEADVVLIVPDGAELVTLRY